MKEEVRKFVEEYNKRMDWNEDIRKSINLDFVPIIKDSLSTEKIDEEGYDLENASYYTHDDGLMELHAFSNTAYRTHYFWVRPYEKDAESAYKTDKIEFIKRGINQRIQDLQPFIAEEKELQKIKERL